MRTATKKHSHRWHSLRANKPFDKWNIFLVVFFRNKDSENFYCFFLEVSFELNKCLLLLRRSWLSPVLRLCLHQWVGHELHVESFGFPLPLWRATNVCSGLGSRSLFQQLFSCQPVFTKKNIMIVKVVVTKATNRSSAASSSLLSTFPSFSLLLFWVTGVGVARLWSIFVSKRRSCLSAVRNRNRFRKTLASNRRLVFSASLFSLLIVVAFSTISETVSIIILYSNAICRPNSSPLWHFIFHFQPIFLRQSKKENLSWMYSIKIHWKFIWKQRFKRERIRGSQWIEECIPLLNRNNYNPRSLNFIVLE